MEETVRTFIIALVLAVGLISSAGSASAATLERLSFEDMAVRSTQIIRGTVMDSWAALTGGVIYTHYRIQVAETFKGPAGSAVEIMVPGGTVNGLRQSFSGSPTLNKGDEFVFFLWTGRGGITWITGLTQGLFSLPAGSATDRTARRAASPELMLDRATGRPVKDVAVTMHLSELRSRIAAALAKGGSQ